MALTHSGKMDAAIKRALAKDNSVFRPISSSDIADWCPAVPVTDRTKVAKLATVFLGLTGIESAQSECISFSIHSAIRVLGEQRRLVEARGL